jgi:ribosomal protein S18 acetylase RimI-like enzyme
MEPIEQSMHSAFLVRAYQVSDAAACAAIFHRAWHSGHPYAPRSIDIAAFEENTREERILVAEHNDRGIVGFASIYEPQSFIHNLYVDPASQSEGIGEALLAHAVALAGGRASLKCQTRNPRALAFYRRLGWVEFAAGMGEFGPWIALRSPG